MKLLNALLLYPIALILLFEEWGWEPLAKAVYRITRMPFLIRLESKILILPPAGVFLIFCFPFVALLPFKFLALYMFGKGHLISGAFLFIIAKIIGTALFARIFQITRPVLMQIKFFARYYPRWINWKNQMLELVRKSQPWQSLQKIKQQIKKWWIEASR